MKNQEKWLELARTKGIKNETLRSLIDYYGCNIEVLKEKIIEHAKNAGCYEKIKFPELDLLQKEIENIANYNGHIITIEDSLYPIPLKRIYNAPLIITAKGLINNLTKDHIAIIGSRKPIFHSQELATEIAYNIAKHGYIVSSGMAAGIDASAHFGALKSGSTTAVLGSGINVPYPDVNSKLYEQICEQGVVISQFPFDTPPRAGNFPARNQIIAGLSAACIVIEAYRNSEHGGGRSGSLITVDFVKDLGRPIYTVPGFPAKDGRFSGNNYLIKENIAHLVENAQDVIEDLLKKKVTQTANQDIVKITHNKQVKYEVINSAKFAILHNLSTIPMSIDQISIATNYDADIIRVALIELELAELITREFDGKVTKI